MPGRVQLMALAAGLVMASAGARADTIVLTVNNPTDLQTYSSISAAVAAANADLNLDNYYDIKVATGTYTNDFANVLRPMTIEAAGGRVRLLATVPPLFNKGIIVTTSSLTVRGLTFEGAAIDDSLGGNGAGIRDQSAGATTLRVENSTFLNNQDAILTAGSNYQETVQIINSTFLNNGSGTGQTHALYVGDALSLLVENSVFCGTLEGHDIKSRAMNTTVRGSQIYDGATGVGCNSAGTTSYGIESTNGGKVIIDDVDISQGSGTHNTTMVRFGADGLFPGPTINSLLVSNTNFTSGNFGIGIQAPANATGCTLSNTTFTGVTTPVSPPSFCTTSTQPDVSPDGSTISGGTGTLVTAHGTWTFGAPASPGNWLILLNGMQASGGVASELEVTNGGRMYAFGTDSRWYVWQSGAWALTTDLPPPPPPSDVSPDGSIISGGTGTLVTADGTWTFGAPASPGNWLILLGGVQASGGVASELEVTNGGRMYAFGTDSRWYVWQGGVWMLTSAPPPPPSGAVSPDGSTIWGGTGTLVTAHGTWTFGAPAFPGNWLILLDGVQASDGVASELEVTNGGRMYAFGTDSRWYVWQSGVWMLTSAPPPPPPDLSPDGSTISGGTGTLVTTHGTWTFGAPASPGNWLILVGGVQASGGVASELEVANGGQIYAFGTDTRWYVWQGGVWTLTTYSPQS